MDYQLLMKTVLKLLRKGKTQWENSFHKLGIAWKELKAPRFLMYSFFK